MGAQHGHWPELVGGACPLNGKDCRHHRVRPPSTPTPEPPPPLNQPQSGTSHGPALGKTEQLRPPDESPISRSGPYPGQLLPASLHIGHLHWSEPHRRCTTSRRRICWVPLEIFNGWDYEGAHPLGGAVDAARSHRSGKVDRQDRRQAADRCDRRLARLRCGGRTERIQAASTTVSARRAASRARVTVPGSGQTSGLSDPRSAGSWEVSSVAWSASASWTGSRICRR